MKLESLAGLPLITPEQNSILAFLTLYMGNRARNYANYMGNTYCLYHWLFTDSPVNASDVKCPEGYYPDLCITCGRTYGDTYSGRLRTTCPSCRVPASSVAYEVQQLSIMLGISQSYLEWLFLMYFKYKLDRNEKWQEVHAVQLSKEEETAFD